jgi:hypothetical protein
MNIANETQNRAHTVAPEHDPIVGALLLALIPYCGDGEQWNLTVIGDECNEYHLSRIIVDDETPEQTDPISDLFRHGGPAAEWSMADLQRLGRPAGGWTVDEVLKVVTKDRPSAGWNSADRPGWRSADRSPEVQP